ncbi:MAG: hypothetical protein M3273_09100 [Actinomycetota bacterium]|nr:hypothetical protein [Actinomycetota bacterium]
MSSRQGEAALPDWGFDPAIHAAPAPAGLSLWALAAAGGIGAVLAWLLLGLLGVAAFAALFLGGLVWITSNAGRAMLRRHRATRVRPGARPRVENIVTGLAPRTGIEVPAVWEIADDGANALVCFTTRPAIALTTGLMESYTRTELEAVVAHCCVRLRALASPLERARLALSYVSPGFGPSVGAAQDVLVAAITRYPPGLASAIAKAVPRSGRGAGFWFAAEGATHVPAAERSKALLDL